MDWFTAFAQATDAAQKQPSLIEMLILPAGFFVILYFFMIRPQQAKLKEHKNFLSAMKVGEEVATTGGIIGTVRSISDTFVTLDVSANSTIKVLKSHIAGSTKPASK
jgi:preprotein translocase subunit YajC